MYETDLADLAAQALRLRELVDHLQAAIQRAAATRVSPARVITPALLTVDEAAEALAVSRSMISKLISAGSLRSVVVGKSRRIPTAAILSAQTGAREATPRRRRRPLGDRLSVHINGRQGRRHVRGRTRNRVMEEVDRIRGELRGGALPGGGQATVTEYLTEWIAAREATESVRPSTITGYRMDAKHIGRSIGSIPIGKLAAEDVERLYRDMLTRGLVPGTVLHAKRTLSACLNTAVGRGRLVRNPVRLAQAPADAPPDIEPLIAAEPQHLLRSLEGQRNPARWMIAVAMGLRQREALGLQWSDIDWKQGTLAVTRALARRPWKHGCGGGCGRRPQDCTRGYPRRVGRRTPENQGWSAHPRPVPAADRGAGGPAPSAVRRAAAGRRGVAGRRVAVRNRGRHPHLVDAAKREASDRMAGMLWGAG